MTHIPIQLPFKGFTEQSAYSTIPEGMTPSCLNVMPVDVFNGRTRIGTRQGTKRWLGSGVQFVGTYRVYESSVLVEKIIIVQGGVIKFGDPQASTGTFTTVTNNTGRTTPLNTTNPVEGVQFNEHFYFVDGDQYTFVHLTSLTGSGAGNGAHAWVQTGGGSGALAARRGPYHTDPNGTVAAGERATLICRWGARLVLAGYKRTPNVWFACGPDGPFSATSLIVTYADGWDSGVLIGADGAGLAVAGALSASYGTVGDPIVAVLPFGQSGLLFGCSNSFSFLTSDPIFSDTSNGDVQLVTLTNSIGIAGQRAWAVGQEKSVYVLANDGLYYLSPNDFNFNRGNRISAGRLDSFFLRLDFGTPSIGGSGDLSGGTLRSIGGSATGATTTKLDPSKNIDEAPVAENATVPTIAFDIIGGIPNGEVFPCLCWDPDREGLWIFLTVNGSESSSVHLYYDAKTDSFWAQKFADPLLYGPISATYVGSSRTNSGKLFLGGSDAINTLDRGYPVGIDGWTSAMTDANQTAQFVRNSLTIGPVIAPLPYRVMLNEVRIDLAEDEYEVPSTFTDLSVSPIVSVSTGDTAQGALGLRADTLFVSNINPFEIDCEGATPSAVTITYDGGDKAAPTPTVVDCRFAMKPFGSYSKSDPFTTGTASVYQGPSDYVLKYVSPKWKIVLVTDTGDEAEYEKTTTDSASPDGFMANLIDVPAVDSVNVSGASFETSEVTEIGFLSAGRNEAIKTRIRSEAMYLTIASDGRPWSIERMSVVISQVGKSRGSVP